MAHLELRLANKEGTTTEELPNGRAYIIGRGATATLRLGDRNVSRRHCSIMITKLHTHLTDLGSKNGTFVNGERVKRNRNLQDGDVIKIGRNNELRFYQ